MTDRPVDPLIAQLRDLRLKAGLKQAEVAEAAGTTFQYLSQVERGKQHPGLAWVRNVGQALGVELAWVPLTYHVANEDVARTLHVAEQTAAMAREAGR